MDSSELNEYCRWLRRQLNNLLQSAVRATAPQRLMFAVLIESIRREFESLCDEEPPGNESRAA